MQARNNHMQARNNGGARGREDPLQIFSLPLKICSGYSWKLLDIV